MKHYGRMSKAELIRRLQALEAGSTPAEGAGEHARLVEELQTHQVELETQNWELREAQHLVEISRDRYADLYDFAPVGYVTLDDKGVIRELNLTAAGMLGSERARLLRVPFHLHVVREDLKPFREYLAQMVTNGQRAVTEVRLARKHAQPLPVLLQSVRQVDEESGRFWCRTSLTDLTERKQAEAALRASAALNHGILSSLSEHLAVLDPAGNILALNEAWIRYARANPDSACWQIQVGDNYLSLCESGLPLPPEAQLAAAGIKAVLQRTQPSFTLEYPCHTAAADHWFLLLVTPLATAGGGAVVSHLDITPRRRAEVALAEQEARLRAVLDTATDAILTFDERGVIESGNQAAEQLFGYPAAELLGKPLSDLIPALPGKRPAQDLVPVRGQGRNWVGHGREVTGYRRDGSTLPVELSVAEVQLGRRRIFTGFGRDLTQRKQAETQLRLLGTCISRLKDIVIITEAEPITAPGPRIVYVNDAFVTHTGYTRAEALGQSPRFLQGPKTSRTELDRIRAALRTWEPVRAELINYTKSGTEFWMEIDLVPVADEQGWYTNWVAVQRDITERKQAEAALRQSEERLRLVLEASQVGIFEVNVEDGQTYWNAVEFELLGLAPDSLPASPEAFFRVVHPEDLKQVRAHWASALQTGHCHMEFRIVRADGEERWLIGLGRFVGAKPGAKPKVGGRFLGVNYDITERKRAEEALRLSEARFRTLSEASPMGICMADTTGQCTYTNPRWQAMSGLSPEESLGDGWTRVIHPADRAGLFAQWEQAVQAEREFVYEFRIVRRDGQVRWVRTLAKAIVDTAGQQAGFVGIDEDITEQKDEEQRRRLQYETARYLAEAGTLAETVPQLLQLFAQTFEWEVGEYWEEQTEPQTLRLAYSWHAPGRQLAAFLKSRAKCAVPQLKPATGHWGAFFSKPRATRAGLRSALALPIVLNNQMMGVMAFMSRRAIEPAPELLQLFVTLGNQIAQFIERQKTAAALREAHEFSKQAVAGAPGGIVVCDAKSNFVVWNPFMEQVTGYLASEVVGRPAREVFPLLREPRFAELFDRALAGEVTGAPDLHFDLPEKGKHGWLAPRFAPWRDGQQQVSGVIVAIRDITERRQLEVELLEASEREQQRIGHDLHDGLGQHLTAMELLSHLLREELAGSDPRVEAQVVKLSGLLREAIGQTRTLARGLAPVKPGGRGLLEGLEDLARRTDGAGQVKCRFRCALPVLVADGMVAGHLYRIAQEAVNNALKHGHARTITLSLSRRGTEVRLCITDNGQGLPAPDQPRPTGSGMGLAVMQQRANLIGALLTIKSNPGQGVTVECRWRRKKPGQLSATAEAAE